MNGRTRGMTRLAVLAAVLGLLLAGLAGPALAVNPDEMLKNPVLEKRAREISSQLRCLVCQNELIDVSDADLARDIRLLVRRRLEKGETDRQVIDYIVSRYGEFVLLKPRFEPKTLVLWGTPVIVLISGAAAMFLYSRSRTGGSRGLTGEEEAELKKLLAPDESGAPDRTG